MFPPESKIRLLPAVVSSVQRSTGCRSTKVTRNGTPLTVPRRPVAPVLRPHPLGFLGWMTETIDNNLPHI
ncbi:hypothetical protein GWI33_021248 [Rhynchophorus ferrugineus]|uniref:Uncharacterized protein n=1 Tax=Rhynchophorus ferrugineus TaxID=354439 RepID=A0A834HMX7_RHYFE|nr:hypothetical protein GWI33_021248 [Rhynchophorus ferrugineus]